MSILTSGVLVILMMLLDFLNITMSRELLLEFLTGETNKRKARKLHAAQNITSKIRMNYIKPYVTKYIKLFRIYYYIYQCTLFTFIPRYATALFFYFILNECLYYYLICVFTIDLLVFFSIRIQFKADHTTKYSHK